MSDKIKKIEIDKVVIRFSGDSGDGMQLTGTQFSDTSALFGNDVVTFPDYPAEIRAPQGTVGGVSGFQLHFGHSRVDTPGDFADVLIAMNPAALKANLQWMKPSGTIIVNIDAFTDRNFIKAGYTSNPLDDDKLSDFNIIKAKVTSLTKECLKDLDIDSKSVLRCKNMFTLGMVYWIFDRSLDHTEKFISKKFSKKPIIVEANKKVLRAGFNFAKTIEALAYNYSIAPADIPKGTYRNITGNKATAWGLMAAAEKSDLELFCGSYPITPATDIFQELAARKDLGVKTMQAEDEIAGICSAIGASYAGALGVTSTSGPGLALKTEAAGLAVMTELPLVIVNVQRGGPSTGLPTKTEQADLMQAIHGRSGESPMPVIAASTPSDCFDYAFQAARIALEYMTPVILLTDGFIANGAEPWKIPSMSDMPKIKTRIASLDKKYLPYEREDDTLARNWAFPGMKGLEHRIGGLEKEPVTGAISYTAESHQAMCDLRAEKVERVVQIIPDLELVGNKDSDLLVVGWGGTYGHLYTAVRELQSEGVNVSLAHFNYIVPLPKNTDEILSSAKKILVCELNNGQFSSYLKSCFNGTIIDEYNKITGLPFTVLELKAKFNQILKQE